MIYTYKIIYSNSFDEKFQEKEIGEVSQREAVKVLKEYREKYQIAFLKLENLLNKGK